MANAHCGGSNSYDNAQDDRRAHVVDSSAVRLHGRSIDVWDAADPVQRLIDLDNEARANMTPEEYSESNARTDAFWAQHEERALAQDRALHNQNDSDVGQGSANMRTRPSDSQFGSDGNQYNPYAPHTSEEYMLQEIEAGRMDPEMMDMPRRLPNPAHSPLTVNGPPPPLAQVHAGGQSLWTAPGHHRPPYRKSLIGRGLQSDVSDAHEASWFQHPCISSTDAEDLGEEEDPDFSSFLLPYFDAGESPNRFESPNATAHPVSLHQEDPFGILGPLTSLIDRPSLTETFAAIGVPRQPHSASTGRERKRLAKPSLVVKLKTPVRKSFQALVSPKRGRPEAPSSSGSSSAAHVTPDPRPLDLRSQGSAGWAPQAVRRMTRRAEAIQSSQRKRRRDAVSPQDVGIEGTTTPTVGLPQGKYRKAQCCTSQLTRSSSCWS